jgi:predicted GIY-YIG superfamily endonuclease
MRKCRGFWNKSKCAEVAKTCNNIYDFKLNYFGAYNSIKRNKWYDILDKTFPNRIKCRGYWTKEKCQIEALKYNSRVEFEKFSGSAYVIAGRNKWLSEICTHMQKLGNRYNKCVYAYEFSDNSVYVGITYSMKKRIHDRNKNKTDSVIIHINETGLIPKLIQLTEYISVDIAVELENKYVNDYNIRGWKILNKVKTGSIGSVLKWTKEKCFEEIKKHSTRTNFIHNSKGAYDATRRNGWTNDIYLSVGL